QMPPIAAPPARAGGRPGGTMPPPIAPMPPQVAAPAAMADPHFPPAAPVFSSTSIGAAPLPVPGSTAASAPVAGPAAAVGAPAPVVPLADKNKGRQLVGQGMKKVIGRALSAPSKRGVQVEPLDPKVVKMLDLQSN